MSGYRDHDDEGAPDFTVLKSAKHKATKPFICDHCGKIIAVGEVYHSAAFLVDGKFEVSRSHTEMGLCNVAAEAPDPYEDLTARGPQ
jgi:hypothetical protein